MTEEKLIEALAKDQKARESGNVYDRMATATFLSPGIVKIPVTATPTDTPQKPSSPTFGRK